MILILFLVFSKFIVTCYCMPETTQRFYNSGMTSHVSMEMIERFEFGEKRSHLMLESAYDSTAATLGRERRRDNVSEATGSQLYVWFDAKCRNADFDVKCGTAMTVIFAETKDNVEPYIEVYINVEGGKSKLFYNKPHAKSTGEVKAQAEFQHKDDRGAPVPRSAYFTRFWLRFERHGYFAVGYFGQRTPFISWTLADPFTVKYIGLKGQTCFFRFRGTLEICFFEFVQVVLKQVSEMGTDAATDLFQAVLFIFNEMKTQGVLNSIDSKLVQNVQHAVNMLNVYNVKDVQSQAREVLNQVKDNTVPDDIMYIVGLIDSEYNYWERRDMENKLEVLQNYPGIGLPYLVAHEMISLVMKPYYRQAHIPGYTNKLSRLINNAIDVRNIK